MQPSSDRLPSCEILGGLGFLSDFQLPEVPRSMSQTYNNPWSLFSKWSLGFQSCPNHGTSGPFVRGSHSLTSTIPQSRTLHLQDDPNATCAFWDENLAKWSSEGVDTLPSESPGTLACSTRHLSIFGGVVSVVLILGRRWGQRCDVWDKEK